MVGIFTSPNVKNLTGRAPFFLVLFQLKSTLASQPRRSSKEKVRSIRKKSKNRIIQNAI